MLKTHEHHTDASGDSKEQFSSDFDALKGSFAQLREDVTKLIGNSFGTGKSGAEALKARAADAAGEVKDHVNQGKERIHDSLHKLGKKIEQRPLTSAAIAMGIGFVLAKMLHSKR